MKRGTTHMLAGAIRRLALASLAFACVALFGGCTQCRETSDGGTKCDSPPSIGDFVAPSGPAPYIEQLVVDHGGSVAVIDPVSGLIVKTIPVGKVPGGAVVTDDASFVYFPDSGGYSRVGVLDGATDERLEAVRTDGPSPVGSGNGTRQAVYAKAGKLLYSTDDPVDESIVAIDTTINAVGQPGHGKTLKHIALGGEPIALASNATGTRVYVLVARAAGAAIAVIDASLMPVVDQGVTEEFPLPACLGWSSLVAHPDDATLYFTCADGLGVVDVGSASATRGTVLTTLTLGNGPGAMVLDADSRLLVLNEGSGRLAIIDVLPGSPTRHTIVGSLPSGTARYLALGVGALYVADPTARTMTQWRRDPTASNGYVTGTVVALPHEPSGIGWKWTGTADRVYVSMGAEGPQQIAMFDGVFPDGSWTSTKAFDTTVGAAAQFAAGQKVTGGAPEFFRSTIHTWIGGAGVSLGLQVTHLRNFATLSAGSAIDHIDWSFDDKVIQQQGGTPGFATFPLLRQDGHWFQRYDVSMATNWTHHDYRGLTATDFINPSAGPPHPDFSPAGGAIEFGYGTANGTSSAVPVTTESGIDNWTVTVVLR